MIKRTLEFDVSYIYCEMQQQRNDGIYKQLCCV